MVYLKNLNLCRGQLRLSLEYSIPRAEIGWGQAQQPLLITPLTKFLISEGWKLPEMDWAVPSHPFFWVTSSINDTWLVH